MRKIANRAGCNLGCSSLPLSLVQRDTRIRLDLRGERLRTLANPLRSSFYSNPRFGVRP